MLISPSDLRGMLRADAVGLVLGLLLMLIGVATLVLGSVLRRRAVSLLWLGAFALLYGSRLLERAAILRLSFEVPTLIWQRIDVGITYAVPIPLALFAPAIFPTWRVPAALIASMVKVALAAQRDRATLLPRCWRE